MVKIHKNIVKDAEIETLLAYFQKSDDRTETRPDVRSKHPRWDIDEWPQTTVKNILDRVLANTWAAEETLFLGSCIPGQGFRLHVDSSDGGPNLYSTVLIPLLMDGPAATIFFKNYWEGPSTRFSKTPISPFTYPLLSNNGVIIVEDIRKLLEQSKHNPSSVVDFTVDVDFIKNLEQLVESRTGNGIAPTDRRTADYSNIINYDQTISFDPAIHSQYMRHIPLENLNGLTLDKVVDWEIGSVIVFPRTQIHCAASTHNSKIGLSVFTNYV